MQSSPSLDGPHSGSSWVHPTNCPREARVDAVRSVAWLLPRYRVMNVTLLDTV